MRTHTKIYMDYFGYDISSFIPCEICGAQAVDINHIKARGMGGSKKMDYIENLMGTCRLHHDMHGDKVGHRAFLIAVHILFMKDRIPYFKRIEKHNP